jgi:PAS domain S-box-containing protein
MKVIINHMEDQGMVHSLVVQLQQIIPSLHEDDPRWRKADELLEMAFYQAHIDRHLLQDSVNHLRERLRVISVLQNDFISATDIQTLVFHVYDLIPKHTIAECASLYLYDEERDALIAGEVPGGYTTDTPFLVDVTSFPSAVSRKCLQEKHSIILNNAAASEYGSHISDGSTQFKSALALPVIEKQKVIGVLFVSFVRRLHAFQQDEIELFQTLADIIAVKIENIRFFSYQNKTQDIFNTSEESYYQIYEDIPVGLFRTQPNGTFLRLNPAMVHILGYPDRETLLRTNAVALYGIPRERVDWQVMAETFNLERESELCLRKYDGTDVWVQHSSRVTRAADGKVLYYDGAIIDVSGRKRAEVQIREAMREKEVLLKEIHHRVKNNLQIVSSLLNLQSAYLRDAYDRELFKQSQNRVKAMALLHEKLYRSAELTQINFDEYLNSMMPNLFQSYKTSSAAIDCQVEEGNVLLDIDTAIPCGLIVSELVANSLKHAFPEGRSGKVSVALGHLDQRRLRLTVSDDGIGMDHGTPSESAGAPMGWELVRTLTEQLNGSIEIDRYHGTRVCITFNEKAPKEGRQRLW